MYVNAQFIKKIVLDIPTCVERIIIPQPSYKVVITKEPFKFMEEQTTQHLGLRSLQLPHSVRRKFLLPITRYNW